MAKSLGLAVIAEGVETVEQEAVIRRIGCNEAQGYLYGHAAPASEFYNSWVLETGPKSGGRAALVTP